MPSNMYCNPGLTWHKQIEAKLEREPASLLQRVIDQPQCVQRGAKGLLEADQTATKGVAAHSWFDLDFNFVCHVRPGLQYSLYTTHSFLAPAQPLRL